MAGKGANRTAWNDCNLKRLFQILKDMHEHVFETDGELAHLLALNTCTNGGTTTKKIIDELTIKNISHVFNVWQKDQLASRATTCSCLNEAGMKQPCFVVGRNSHSERYVDLSGVDLVGVKGFITYKKHTSKKHCLVGGFNPFENNI